MCILEILYVMNIKNALYHSKAEIQIQITEAIKREKSPPSPYPLPDKCGKPHKRTMFSTNEVGAWS